MFNGPDLWQIHPALFMEYEAVIGLETHVQLKTKSKMWCGCANAFGAPPNTNVCPVCLGMPGVLPVANEEALRLTALTGLLLNCTIPAHAKFDRKNYFYPDMPKNYQITQYDQSLDARQGHVDFEFEGRHRPGPHHPGPPGGGRGQELPLRAPERRGFQPRRRAAAGDRHPSRTSPAPTWLTPISTR